MRRLALGLVHVAGVAAFAWPLLLGAPSEGRAHASDAPLLLVLLVPLLVAAAAAEAGGERRDARVVALLGVLVAVNAFLRIPKGPSGESFVFVLPILCGWTFGSRFGFLLGSLSMLASAVLTGGVGPWLPFQMFALGWVGAGAGLLRRVVRGRLPVVSLVGYALVSSLAYGFVMNLWFWPFLAPGRGDIHFAAGLGWGEVGVRYWRFYLLTSLPWDMGRALLTNVPLVAVLARPVGRLLERTKNRFTPQVVIVGDAEGATTGEDGERETRPVEGRERASSAPRRSSTSDTTATGGP